VLADRRTRRLAMLLGTATVFGVIAFSYWLYLATFVANADWTAVFRFDQNRESDMLSPIPVLVQIEGVAEYLADRASGVLVAFWPGGKYSYARAYHVFQYSPLVAGPLLALEGARWLGAARRQRLWRWLRSPASPAWILLVLLAAGGFLSIHTLHKQYSREWNFALRQALTCVFLFFLALVYLLKNRRRWAVALGLSLTLAGSALGSAGLLGTIRHLKEADPERVGRQPWKPKLTAWLLERRRERGELTVAASYFWPQRLAASTPGVNYHWVYWGTTREDLVLMFQKLGVRYLVVQREASRKLEFYRPGPEFLALFQEIERIDGFRIFVLRDSDSTRRPSSRARAQLAEEHGATADRLPALGDGPSS
jgi:hypothetical protein